MDRKTEEGKRKLWNMLNRSIQAEYISLPLCQPADSDYEMGKHCSCLCQEISSLRESLNTRLGTDGDRDVAYSARTAHPFQRNGAPFRFKLSKAQQVD